MNEQQSSLVLDRAELFINVLNQMRHEPQTPQYASTIAHQHSPETFIYIPPNGAPVRSNALYIIAPIIGFIILVMPVIIGYVLSWGLDIGRYILSVYAFMVLGHFMLQIVLASTNRYTMSKVSLKSIETPNNVSLLVVGYKEDPKYWRRCLESIRDQNINNLHVVAVIDGDTESDEYMALEFMSTFKEGRIVKPGFILGDVKDRARQDHFTLALRNQMKQYTCIMQPHSGKRAAIYTGLKLLSDHESVVVTDSDTILASNAVMELYSTLMNDETIGAVTGYVDIDNDNNLLSFMSSLRYWFAFNLERSCDSFAGSVTCISGPLGIYRTHAFLDILTAWYDQRFLKERCTYGDDRHLTNLTLNQGYQTKFTHRALCKTETPTELIRWISQQTRWTKSFYREMFFYRPEHFTWRCIWIYSSLIFNAFFPVLNVYAIISILYISPTLYSSHALFSLLIWIITVVSVALLKSIYGFALSQRWRLLAFPLYSLLYIAFLLPIKITSVLFIRDNSWMTSPRLKRVNDKPIGIIVSIILWNLVLLGGILYSIISFYTTQK